MSRGCRLGSSFELLIIRSTQRAIKTGMRFANLKSEMITWFIALTMFHGCYKSMIYHDPIGGGSGLNLGTTASDNEQFYF